MIVIVPGINLAMAILASRFSVLMVDLTGAQLIPVVDVRAESRSATVQSIFPKIFPVTPSSGVWFQAMVKAGSDSSSETTAASVAAVLTAAAVSKLARTSSVGAGFLPPVLNGSHCCP